MPNEIRSDHRGPRPSLDGLVTTFLLLFENLADQLDVDAGAFFQRSSHDGPYLRFLRMRDDEDLFRSRVFPPFAKTPVLDWGSLPDLERPSPPPMG